MIVWGGFNGPFNTGGRYDPSTDSWTATSTTNAPAGRARHSAVWTGSEMIVWGGYNYGTSILNILNTGGRYNPSTDSWRATSTTNAPAARESHVAVWTGTGSEMIVWGGSVGVGSFFNTGGKYCAAPTPTPCDSGVIQNGGFETGDFTGWVIDGHVNDPVVTNTLSHTGTYSALAGLNPQQQTFCAENNNEPLGDSSFYQQFTVPAGGGTLSFWYWTCTFDFLPRDWQDAYVTDSNGAILQTIFHQCSDNETWVQQTVDMGPYAGQTVRIKFLVHQDGRNPPSDITGMYVDDVALFAPCAPVPTSAVSRKVHGAAGTFDVPLPLTGNVGVECRSGGATNDYQMIINFATTVTVESASVTSGTGSVTSFGVSGSQVTVNLTGVTNVQTITVTLFNVNDGTHMGNVPVSMGVLVGDVNGNAVVNASDVSLTKSQVGQAVSSSNFREDVNANGVINSVDIALVKSKVGTALPP